MKLWINANDTSKYVRLFLLKQIANSFTRRKIKNQFVFGVDGSFIFDHYLGEGISRFSKANLEPDILAPI